MAVRQFTAPPQSLVALAEKGFSGNCVGCQTTDSTIPLTSTCPCCSVSNVYIVEPLNSSSRPLFVFAMSVACLILSTEGNSSKPLAPSRINLSITARGLNFSAEKSQGTPLTLPLSSYTAFVNSPLSD